MRRTVTVLIAAGVTLGAALGTAAPADASIVTSEASLVNVARDGEASRHAWSRWAAQPLIRWRARHFGATQRTGAGPPGAPPAAEV
jgi:hypothetical protein